MSETDDYLLQREQQMRRNRLRRKLQAGLVLVASTNAPSAPNLRQTVHITCERTGIYCVRVQRYEPTEWSVSVEEFEKRFDEIDAALLWLQEIDVHWTLLHEPRLPLPRELDG